MDAAAGEKHHVAARHVDTVKAVGDAAGTECSFEGRARDASLQPDEEFRTRSGVGDVPHLGFRVAEMPGAIGRMNLQ